MRRGGAPAALAPNQSMATKQQTACAPCWHLHSRRSRTPHHAPAPLCPKPSPRHRRGKGAPGGAGYDLNRNFPDQWKDKGADLTKPAAGTQPEVAAVMAFSLTRNWLAGANFHEGDMVRIGKAVAGGPQLGRERAAPGLSARCGTAVSRRLQGHRRAAAGPSAGCGRASARMAELLTAGRAGGALRGRPARRLPRRGASAQLGSVWGRLCTGPGSRGPRIPPLPNIPNPDHQLPPNPNPLSPS